MAIVALAAAGTLALLAPGAGARAAPRVKVPLPRSGQATVVIAQLRYTADSAPRDLKLKLPNRAKLSRDERGIYALYRKRRGRTTALTFVSLLLRKEGGATGSARSASSPLAGASDENFLGVELGLFFLQSHFVDEGAMREEEIRRDERERDEAKLIALTQVIGDDAPIGLPPRMGQILEYGGVVKPPAPNPGKLGANLLDTGHYDDGHSFGWNRAGAKPAIGSWLKLTDGPNASYEELIEEIERNLKADLDGDGEVDKPKPGGGGKIDTEVGVPVIS